MCHRNFPFILCLENSPLRWKIQPPSHKWNHVIGPENKYPRFPLIQMAAHHPFDRMDKVSYLVVDNLHCPSCIFTIKSTLNDALNIPATNVDVSLVNQTVTVRHNETIAASTIAQALEKVGFEVQVEGDDESTTQSSWIVNPLANRKRKRRHREICKSCQADHRKKQGKKSMTLEGSTAKSSIYSKSACIEKTQVFAGRRQSSCDLSTEFVISGMTCTSRVHEITEGVKAYRSRGVVSCDVDVISNLVKVSHDGFRISADEVAELLEQLGYHAEIVSSRPMSRRQRAISREYPAEYRLEFHIGGMTCASCSNAIIHGLNDEPYIKSVNVNLMANSGTAILSNKDDAEKVKEAVELIGFTCDLGEIAPLRSLEGPLANDVRLVRIRIDGMDNKFSPFQILILILATVPPKLLINWKTSLESSISHRSQQMTR